MLKSFIKDGQNSKDLGLIVSSIQRPILPTLRKREMTIPGKDGTWDFGNNKYENIIIPVVCYMIQPTREQIRNVAEWLSTKGNIYFYDEPEKYYIGRVFESLAEEIQGATGMFVIPFECEPYALADQEAYNEVYIYDDNFIYDIGQIYPNEKQFDWLYYRQGMGLYNHEEKEVDIEIKITGSVEGIKITHVETGVYLNLNYTLVSNTVIIDTESYTVELEDGTNLLTYMTGDFMKVKAKENSFIFEGIGPNCVVEYKWKHKTL